MTKKTTKIAPLRSAPARFTRLMCPSCGGPSWQKTLTIIGPYRLAGGKTCLSLSCASCGATVQAWIEL